MDAKTTLEGQTTQTISETYFASLNDRITNKLHLIQEKNVPNNEIQADARLWYAGFSACAKLLGTNTSQLPMVDSVLQTITKNFPEKAKIAA